MTKRITARAALVAALVLVMAVAMLAVAACTKDEGKFSIAIASYDQAGGSVSVSQPLSGKLYAEEETVTVTVAANSGWQVQSFAVTGKQDAKLDAQGKYTFAITQDVTITVSFVQTQQQPTEFAVNVAVVPEGSATVTLDPQKEVYSLNEQVTATVEVAAGVYLGDVYVNGRAVQLTDGKVTFAVTEETDFEVYTITRSEKIVRSLQGSVRFAGTIVNTGGSTEREQIDVESIFDASNAASLLRMWTGPMVDSLLVRCINGVPIQTYHNIDGTLVEDEIVDPSTGDPVPAEYYSNPFEAIGGDQLVATDNADVFRITDETVIKNIVATVVHVTVADGTNFALTLNVEDDSASGLEITFGLPGGITRTITLSATDKGTASVPADSFVPYDTDVNAELKQALEAAAKATSYKTKVTMQKYGSTDSESFDIFYTEDAIYESPKGEEKGTFVRNDNNLWSFTYDPETEQFAPDMVIGALPVSYNKADFTLQSGELQFYYFFEQDEDGNYIVHVDDRNNQLCTGFARRFVTGVSMAESAELAVTMSITVENGKPSKVQYYAKFTDDYYLCTLEFSGWDETELPFSIPEGAYSGKISEKFSGTWASEQGEYIVDIDIDSFRFCGRDIEEYTSGESSITFTDRSQQYSLTVENGKMSLTGSGEPVQLIKCKWAQFIGEFVGENTKHEIVTVNIHASGITVTIGTHDPQEAVGVDGDYWSTSTPQGESASMFFFAFTLDGKAYELQQRTANNNDRFILVGDGNSEVSVDRDSVEEMDDWSAYYGTFGAKGGNYTVEIGADSLKITHGTEVTTLTAGQFTFIRGYNYDSAAYYFNFRFELNGVYSVIETHVYNNYLWLYIYGEEFYSERLFNDTFTMDWSDRVSTWEAGTDKDHFRVEITADKVIVTLAGGEPIEATVDYYDPRELFVLIVDGRTWTFSMPAKGSLLSYALLISEAGDAVMLDEVLSWQAFVGTYVNGDYKAEITADSLFITMDGERSEAEKLQFKMSMDYASGADKAVFDFYIGSRNYILEQFGTDGNVWWLHDSNWSVDVKLRVEGTSVDLSQFIGEWHTRSGETPEYKLIVTADGITFLINGVEQETSAITVSLWGSNWELEFKAAGETWTLSKETPARARFYNEGDYDSYMFQSVY